MAQIQPELHRRRMAWWSGLLLITLVAGLSLAAQAQTTTTVVLFAPEERFEVRFGSHGDETTLGAGVRVADSWWVLGNLDRLGEANPRTSVSAVFEVPEKFLMFTVYGGPGVHVDGGTNEFTAHVLGGARFWVLYWEHEYPLANGDAYHRAGFRLDF